jgi:ribosomal protein S18 acetylase RimI-like enzyme
MNKNGNIVMLGSEEAEALCIKLTANLPEYFGLAECNLHYTQGVKSRINFAYQLDNDFKGLLSLDFPYPENANIYWMAVKREYHRAGIGQALIP